MILHLSALLQQTVNSCGHLHDPLAIKTGGFVDKPASWHSSSSVGSHCTVTRSLKEGARSCAAAAAAGSSAVLGTACTQMGGLIRATRRQEACRNTILEQQSAAACLLHAQGSHRLLPGASAADWELTCGGTPAVVPSDSPTMLPGRLVDTFSTALGDSKVVTAASQAAGCAEVGAACATRLNRGMPQHWRACASLQSISAFRWVSRPAFMTTRARLKVCIPDVSCSSVSRSVRLCSDTGCGSVLWTCSAAFITPLL